MHGKTMKAGHGVWARCNAYGDEVERIKNDGDDPGEGWYPVYAAARVRGDTYEYYNGNDDWTRQANAAMRSDANSNFRRSQMY